MNPLVQQLLAGAGLALAAWHAGAFAIRGVRAWLAARQERGTMVWDHIDALDERLKAIEARLQIDEPEGDGAGVDEPHQAPVN